MRKIIFLALLMSLATGPFIGAAERERTEIPQVTDLKKHDIKGEMTVNGKTFHVISPPRKVQSMLTRGAELTPVITNAPGTKQLYCKDVVGYALGTPIQAYSVAASLNWDGDDAYFLDIITAAPMGTYVKGTKQNNELILQMNQTVLAFDDEEYALNLGLLRPIFTIDTSGGGEDIYVWFEHSDDYDYITYKNIGGGSWELQDLSPKYSLDETNPAKYGFPYYMIGYYYTDDYAWSGYCDVFQIYDEFNFDPVVLPENLPMQTMSYINEENMGVIVSVYEAEDALYLKGLSAYLPDAVIKASKVNGGKQISVAPDQFIGIEQDVYYVVTSTVKKNAKGEIEKVEDGSPVYFNLERDSETGKILSISSSGSGHFLALNDDPFYFYPVDIFMNLNLTLQESFAGTPCTPQNAYYEEYASLMGANFIFFELSSFADNGDIIDIDNLYYAIFINGEIIEFEEENGFNLLGEELTMYAGIKRPTTLVPYTFSNSVDLYEDSGGTFVVGLYAEGIDTVGVEAVYKWDGTTTYSQLVTIDAVTGQETLGDPIETKVETINTAEILSVEYYDLKGMKITNPSKGLYVKKYHLSDGTSRTTKVLVR